MLFLLDTTIFSDLMRSQPQVESRLRGLGAEDRAIISPIVRGEILHGLLLMPDGARKRNLELRAKLLFTAISSQPLPVAAADAYAVIKHEMEQNGLSLDANDLWIAASAAALNAVLVTRDSDLKRLSGVTVEDWSH